MNMFSSYSYWLRKWCRLYIDLMRFTMSSLVWIPKSHNDSFMEWQYFDQRFNTFAFKWHVLLVIEVSKSSYDTTKTSLIQKLGCFIWHGSLIISLNILEFMWCIVLYIILFFHMYKNLWSDINSHYQYCDDKSAPS